jgi:hypothetical protein
MMLVRKGFTQHVMNRRVLQLSEPVASEITQISGVVGSSCACPKVFQIGQYPSQIFLWHAKPACQRGRELIGGCAWQQAALSYMPLVLG